MSNTVVEEVPARVPIVMAIMMTVVLLVSVTCGSTR